MKIPLFPLNTVLFPGVPLNLHIFEPRYKEMIGFCLEEKQPFGVVLIRRGREALGPLADPYEVGCSAAIIQNEPLEGGQINIAAVGVERFRIRSLVHDRAYLVGEVDTYPVRDLRHKSLAGLADRLRPWVRQYLQTISDSVPDSVESDYLPGEPVALAYIAAFLVQAPALEKQKLLETESMPELLGQLEQLFRRETAILKVLIRGNGPSDAEIRLN